MKIASGDAAASAGRKTLCSLRKELYRPSFRAWQAVRQRSLQLRDGEVLRLMQVWVAHATNIGRIMAEIDQPPINEVVLMLEVPAEPTTEHALHEQ